jgi:hypothetical protein
MTSTTEVMEVKAWKLQSGSVNDYAPLVSASDKDIASGMFDTSGASLSWSRKPKVEVFIEPGKKEPKPLADVSALTPGALVMNNKAKLALEPFLSRFGQFLEMDCAGEPRWFYNVTNLIPCIDEARSAKRPSGSIAKEGFFDDKIPIDAAVFKDPLTAAAVLYVNEAGKAALEAIITKAAIVGMALVELGPPPKKPRPRF